MFDARPIGVFDSGVGGLTVARALMDLLPDERITYLGDTARGPYGPRELEEVRGFTRELVDWLVDHGAKLVVAACNTATAAALESGAVGDREPVPVIGVIRPAVAAAARATRTGRVGVIGTRGTIASGAYERAVEAVAPGITLFSQACPRFVSLVEAGRTTGDEVLQVAREYLAPLVAAEVDSVILGCTHYPLLTGVLSYLFGSDVVLISSAEETARRVVARLIDDRLLAAHGSKRAHEFVVSGEPEAFRELAIRFLGPRLATVPIEHIDSPVAVASW